MSGVSTKWKMVDKFGDGIVADDGLPVGDAVGWAVSVDGVSVGEITTTETATDEIGGD